MKITDNWIKENTPCKEALMWWDKKERDSGQILKKLIKEKKYNWANWFIVRIMPYKDYVSYAVFAAELVLPIYEKKHPDDKCPRQAIEAAKKCIDNPTDENKKAAAYVANAAYAAYAWYAVVYAVTYEAKKEKILLKILNYGMKLLEILNRGGTNDHKRSADGIIVC